MSKKFKALLSPKPGSNSMVVEHINEYLKEVGPFESAAEAAYIASTLAGYGIYYTVTTEEV